MNECGDLSLCVFSKERMCYIGRKTSGPAGGWARESFALAKTSRIFHASVLSETSSHHATASTVGLVIAHSSFHISTLLSLPWPPDKVSAPAFTNALTSMEPLPSGSTLVDEYAHGWELHSHGGQRHASPMWIKTWNTAGTQCCVWSPQIKLPTFQVGKMQVSIRHYFSACMSWAGSP